MSPEDLERTAALSSQYTLMTILVLKHTIAGIQCAHDTCLVTFGLKLF